MTIADTTQLQRMVDRYRLAHVLEMLALVCHENAKHAASGGVKNLRSDEWYQAARTVLHTVTDNSIRAVDNSR